MDRISAGRALIGDSLGFHLIFVIFGVGLPLLISAMELYGIIKKNPRARMLARTWSKALVILFIVGAVSGTVVSMQFNLFWPKFVQFVSKPVGISFVLEGLAFMLEAVFLSVYMLSWDKFKPIYHWLCGVIVALGAVASGVFITTVNAFMNQPTGFTLGANGLPTNVHVLKAVFNPATPTEVIHSMLAYVFATILVLLAIYTWLYLKKRHAKERKWMAKLITYLAILAVIVGLAVVVAGDQSAKYLAKHEPYKLAAAEGLITTQTHAPLIIGGIVTGGQIKYGLKIPSLLSFLATNHFGAEVEGLNKVPPADRPPLAVHYFFDGMVGIGILTVFLPALFLILKKWRRKAAFSKPLLLSLVVCGFLGILASEFGWLLTELGRQPYVVRGYLKVGDALTTSTSVIRYGFIFPALYTVLLVLAIYTLKRTMKHGEIKP